MNNLVLKANEQAASLEQTAAAQEINSITRNNTENATKMVPLGQTVKKSVFTGEQLASKIIFLWTINEKVNAINEAITVIDQIAFQTNILHLMQLLKQQLLEKLVCFVVARHEIS
ncbi:MAG: hypothetical protein R2837_08455 [Aliarcobacter sp.]